MWTICMALAASVSLSVQAADPKRDRNWVPPQDDATVGVLGGARKDQPPEVRGNPNAAIPSVVQPKVETSTQHQDIPNLSAAPSGLPTPTNPTIAPAGSEAAPLDAAPRSSVQPQGPGGYYTGSPTLSASLPPISPTDTFLAQHPFISGLVAGAVGTEIGSLFYGGVMTGNSDAVMIGYVARMGLILLVILMVMRAVWKSVANRAPVDPPSRQRTRREPGFGASNGRSNREGRREPTL